MLLVASNDIDDHHDTWSGHPERPARTRAALDGLVVAGLPDAVVPLPGRAATRDELERVHHRDYLDALEVACAASVELPGPTPTVPGSWPTALLAAGAGLAAVDGLDAGEGDAALVLTRPPGHHALPSGAMGFCLLNNIAVTAASLVARGERVAIIDWDVHHGNGTQDAFWDDPRVLFVSTHQRALYPNTGYVDEVGGAGALGLTVNIPLPAGATGDVLQEAMSSVVGPAVESFAPTWVLVSAGFDAHRADPLADFDLSAGDFADLARVVASFAPAAGRLVLFLEGGYDLDALRLSVGATASAVLGERFRPEAATAGGPGLEALAFLRQRRAEVLAQST
jgi:acetoin utilization deacetylase AcuC-like enzyme